MWHSWLEWTDLLDVIFRRDYGKQVSVAGVKKKGKSGRVQKTCRLRHGLRLLMALAVPEQKNQEHNDGEHEPPEVAASSGGAAHWNVCHTYVVDTISSGNVCPRVES